MTFLSWWAKNEKWLTGDVNLYVAEKIWNAATENAATRLEELAQHSATGRLYGNDRIEADAKAIGLGDAAAELRKGDEGGDGKVTKLKGLP